MTRKGLNDSVILNIGMIHDYKVGDYRKHQDRWHVITAVSPYSVKVVPVGVLRGLWAGLLRRSVRRWARLQSSLARLAQ